VRLRIEDTPSNRGHVALLRRLWSLAKEANVDAVALELRDSPSDSMAHAEELRDAMFNLRRNGKRVVCHLEDASGASLYVCSAANRVLINPAGGVRFAGLHSEQLYLSGIMQKLGVGADFVRIGAHKAAPEQFTNASASETARADRVDFMQQLERHFTEGVSIGRNLSFEQVRASVGRGPFTSEQAKTEGFVDRLVFEDELEREVRDVTGRNQPLLKDQRAPRVKNTFGQSGAIAVVYVDGDIIDGRNRTIPLLGTDLVGSYTIAETLKSLRDDNRIKAIVLRVESPGGSSVGSDVMWRQVKLASGVKPVVVSMGSVAASGGYYVAAPATRVFANPSTVTGSIGVFYGKADLSELLKKVGVDIDSYKTHEHADADGMYRRFTEEERATRQAQVGEFYKLFVSRVAEGRKLTKERVDELGQGRVWTGEQAVQNGLADELGGLRQALAFARQKAELPDDAPVLELPQIEESLLSRIIGIPGLAQNLYDLPMPKNMTHALQALSPFLVFDSELPLARLEMVPPRLD
jgi:protease-4